MDPPVKKEGRDTKILFHNVQLKAKFRIELFIYFNFSIGYRICGGIEITHTLSRNEGWKECKVERKVK